MTVIRITRGKLYTSEELLVAVQAAIDAKGDARIESVAPELKRRHANGGLQAH